jgi:hypothetical protein
LYERFLSKFLEERKLLHFVDFFANIAIAFLLYEMLKAEGEELKNIKNFRILQNFEGKDKIIS